MKSSEGLEIPTNRLDEIGNYVASNIDSILAEWVKRSREEHPEASDEQRKELENSLPDFLTEFGESLSEGKAEIPKDHAIEHGLQRWEIGWNIESLARDFLILRRVIVNRLQHELKIDPDLAMAVAATMDEAVAVSIDAYVNNRELELEKRNEALNRKNYELKRFAHMVAHEVRNPLGLMSLAVSGLEQLYGNDQIAAPHFELVREGRQTIVDVIENLVQYADLELDQDISAQPVDLNSIFDEAVEHLQFLIEATSGNVQRDDLPTIIGDRVPLLSVFQNLIENALKYSGDKKPDVHVSAEENDDCVNIRFRDKGIGIAEDDQAAIFRFLARANVDPDVQGTGVGLALCRRIAEQHAGTLTVESKPGKGSTFTLCLPKDGPAAEDSPCH